MTASGEVGLGFAPHSGWAALVGVVDLGRSLRVVVRERDSAGRKGRSLAETLASHALIHTADGDHFRTALARAAARSGLPVVRVPARELTGRVAAATRMAGSAVVSLAKTAGREPGPPWGADQKAAALVAWLVLKSGEQSQAR